MRDPRFDGFHAWAQGRQLTPEEVERIGSLARKAATGHVTYGRVKEAEEEAEEFRQQRLPWWYVFEHELVSVIREEPSRLQAWIDMLQQEVAVRSRDFSLLAMLSGEDVGLRKASEEWSGETDPFSVWDHRSSKQSYWNDRIDSRMNLLIRIAPKTGLCVLDALPFPGMMERSLHSPYDFVQDRELLEELLVDAPPTFDADGGWLPGRSVAALLMAGAIVAHAKGLRTAVSQKLYNMQVFSGQRDAVQETVLEGALRELESKELPTWMRRAFGILIQRPDGRTIALGYLSYLARQVLVGSDARPRFPRDKQHQWLAFAEGLAALSAVLAEAGVNTGTVRVAWQRAEVLAKEKTARATTRRMVHRIEQDKKTDRHGEGSRKLYGEGLPYLFGTAAMLGSEPKAENELHGFWCWFEELLEGRDPGLTLLTHGNSIVAAPVGFGFLLSHVSQPADMFRKTYDRLESQRRRALYASGYEDFNLDLESTLLVRVGLHAAESWYNRVKATGDREAPRQMFHRIYAAARRLWLTATLDFTGAKKSLVPLCFAFMPVLFGDDLGVALAKTIPPIATNPRLLAEACWFLWKNGVDASRLARLVHETGADLEQALRDTKQWAELLTSEQRELEFPPDFLQLAEALGISFPEEEPAPESARMTQRRNDFLRSIPWGAALLRRLDEDGLTRFWFSALDVGTWLLQATTPNALRDRFGLAPQIRVLVVHGQVRGRDLRRALQEPREVGEVDPDLLIVASDWPVLHDKIRHLAGPWGQRIPWTPDAGSFLPLAEALREHLPRFDLFARRDPIRGRAFIGRRDRIDDLAARLLRGQAVAVLGLRKVGKSSLLQAVAARIDPLGAQRGMFGLLDRPMPEAEAEALVVSFDVQGLVERTLPGLTEQLAKELRARLELAGVREASSQGIQIDGSAVVVKAPSDEIVAGPLHAQELAREDPMADLERLLHLALDAQPRPIAVVLDEYDLLFEGYGGEPGIPEVHRLFGLLRSLSQATGRVSLAFIGRDPVFVQRPHLGGFTSPLLGWVEPTWLGPLRRDEADELLVRLGKRTCLEVGAATLETAWQWTGGHPLLVREYGSALFELAHAPPSRPRTAETDTLCDDAVEVFYRRDAVQTICGEVQVLLELRFPEALELLTALADAPAEKGREVVTRYGGPRAMAAAALAGFGLLMDPTEQAWVADVWRSYFKTFTSRAGSVSRSGTGGE